MKKVFALLMVLALLAPMGLVAKADSTVEAKPFYAVGWSDLNQEKFPYVDGVVTMNIAAVVAVAAALAILPVVKKRTKAAPKD